MVQFGIKKQAQRPLSPTGNSAMAPHPLHRKRCHRYNAPGVVAQEPGAMLLTR